MFLQYGIEFIIGYLLGCFSTAYLIGKHMGKIDIRNHGSGNAGATNMIRVLGVKAGILTFLGDALKGAIAVLIGYAIGHETGGYICGAAAIIGHNWPFFLKFKGGKGIATSIGAITIVQPVIALILLVLGIILIAITRYVSLASVGGAAAFPIIILFTKWNDKPLVIFAVFLGIAAIVKHKSNIYRLLTGTENKIGAKKNHA